jgi:PAS domain S-box-containing protein
MLELLDLGQSLVVDLNGRILHWTRGCCELYGYTVEEAIGQISHSLLQTRFPLPLNQLLAQLQETGRWQGDLNQRRRDGQELIIASSWALHSWGDGSGVAILQSGTDITGLKRAELALQESEERFRGTFESAAVGITHIDPQGRWIRVNRKLCQTLDYTEAELVGKYFLDYTHPDDREDDLRQYERLMRGEIQSYSIEKRYFRRDGVPVWVRVTRSSQNDAGGKAAYSICVSVIEDIAARKAAEEAGRDPSELKCIVGAPSHISDDLADAREQSRWFPAMVSNHVMDLIERYGWDSDIPSELTDFVKARKFYDYSEHSRVGAKHGEFVSDEICDRFCVIGNAEQCTAKLRELESVGVDQFNVYLMTRGQEETLQAYGDQIIPQFSGVAA